MIICICRAVSDRQIRSSISQGASSIAQVRAELGAGGCCGKCAPQVRQMIQQHASGQQCGSTGAACACALAA
ncbi:MAG: (2Fe-2S)-binding protein [Burkholderiaceae bacterium]|nr:(2Fe-2S)-binding protein [Burkholderiaceae bacterium]